MLGSVCTKNIQHILRNFWCLKQNIGCYLKLSEFKAVTMAPQRYSANRNVDYCTETLKASQVIDYTVNSWWETLGPNSVDVVFDCIGEAGCADHALQVLRTGGSFVSIMFQKSETTREDVKCGAFVNSDTNLDNLEQLDALKAIVEAGKLRMPRIDHSFALAQIDDALAQSASKRTVGKAVLECSGEPIYEDEDGDATLVRVNTDNEVRRTYSSGTTRPVRDNLNIVFY